MLHDEDAELQDLRRKAYGRAAGITDAEAARLRELESARTKPTPAVVESPYAHAREDVPAALPPESAEPPIAEESEYGVTDDAEQADPQPALAPLSSLRQSLRDHWRPVAAASVLLLAAGVGGGWMLFSPRSNELTLSEEEAQRKTALYEDGEFDDGSLRAVARDDDALVWYATKSDPEPLSCMVLDVGEQSQTNCVAADDVDGFALNASIAQQDDTEGADGLIGGHTTNAYILLSTGGEPMAAIQRWDFDDSMLDQFEGEERTRAEALIADGYQPGVSLAGYFRGAPVWIADRFGDPNSTARCVIADAVEATACADYDDAIADGLTLSSEPGEESQWSIEVGFTKWHSAYLTITEAPVSTSTFVIDSETGDPIEVKIPEDDAGG